MVTVHRKGPPLKSWDRLKEVNKGFDQKLAQASGAGLSIAFRANGVVPELFAGWDMMTIAGEWYGSKEAFLQDNSLLETAEACGFPHEVCSYSRMSLGSMVEDRGFLGSFPRLSAVVGLEGECNMQAKWHEIHARYLNVPYFVIDIPPIHLPSAHSPWDEEAARDSFNYLVRQLHGLIDLMSWVMGKKPDEEKMVNALKAVRQVHRLWDEVMELWRAVPSPVDIKSLYSYENLTVALPLAEETTEVLTALVEELKERVRDGVSAIEGEEIRLLWNGIPAWYMLNVMRHFEDAGAAFVGSVYLRDMGTRIREIELAVSDEIINKGVLALKEPTNLDECLEEIAKHYLLSRGIRPRAQVSARIAVEIAKLAKADGIVYHLMRACKGISYGQLVERELIREQLKIPCLLLEGSPADSRDYSPTTVMHQINTFLEQVRGQKEANSRR